ncbi:hypothetical protein GJ698_01870 [Pseudoduganella sp. FT26W]|uniref:Uncharacterized protein n=1 Tax=Duganella aquatilis TaxID=2666082 RepID=A0A844CSC6_9BURK|nr:hypothetical protein [Duganella aquatilis]MRW82838.1 hypothetical protein [Duganella aquatilis]
MTVCAIQVTLNGDLKQVGYYASQQSPSVDVSGCQLVLLSGSDFNALNNRIAALESRPAGSSGTGASNVNVSADIFVGALLVLCFALGWIAGGQR